MEDYDEEEGAGEAVEHLPKMMKKGNVLPLWGNERTMNMNPLILTNIQSSHYFKVNLYELKTYHEVIDEIFYKVQHIEPWEKGSRKTAGQTGMCGGVRGVGAGGIVSTAYCLLYKLFTLRLTRKQLNGLINHQDSPFLRALGFMYIRYTQPPGDLYDWYDEYLEDEEELDVKAGGGQVMTIGDMLRAFLTKLEWFSTLFPRIPVPIQQKNERLLNERFPPPPKPTLQQLQQQQQQQQQQRMGGAQQRDNRNNFEQDNDRYSNSRGSNRGNDRYVDRGAGGNRGDNRRGYDQAASTNNVRERERDRDTQRDRVRSPVRDRGDRGDRGDRERDRSPVRDRDRERERDRHRDDSRRDHKVQHRDSHRDRDARRDRGRDNHDRPRSNYHR